MATFIFDIQGQTISATMDDSAVVTAADAVASVQHYQGPDEGKIGFMLAYLIQILNDVTLNYARKQAMKAAAAQVEAAFTPIEAQ